MDDEQKLSAHEFRKELNGVLTSLMAARVPMPVFRVSVKCRSCAASSVTHHEHGNATINKCDYCGGSDIDVRKC